MKKILGILAFTTLGAAPASAKTQDQKLYALLQSEWDYRLKEHPEQATYVGVAGSNHLWTDHSAAARENRHKHDREFLAQIRKIPEAQLSAAARQHRAIILQSAQDAVDLQPFPTDLLYFNQLSGIQNSLDRVLTAQPHRSDKDFQDHLERLRRIPLLLEQVQLRLEQGLKAGISSPQLVLREVPGQIEGLIPKDCTQSPLLKAVQETSQKNLQAEACAVLDQKVRPAVEKFLGFFKNTYLAQARTTIGIDALPAGKAWYQALIRSHTTTDLTAGAIHQIGLQEVARIETGMNQIINDLKFKGDRAAFFEFLRTDPQFYLASKEELLVRYRDLAKRVDGELLKIVKHPPRLPYGVFEIPAYNAKSQPIAYYNEGSLKSGRVGQFQVNTYDLKSQPTWGMAALTLHESVPGHHLQIALADELENVPELVKNNGVTAFVEGWGLYAESLGTELGFYEDPYAHFGQLVYEMWRAVRLVVDTGLHSKNWTREQAIQYFAEKTGKSQHESTVEVDRYIVWPGQALAYKIGELKIKELRNLAQTKLGQKFDLREFHDIVLGQGAIPLSLLESNVKEWIQRRS